jgi:branched-chain amino acid transport system substrate-binding protein
MTYEGMWKISFDDHNEQVFDFDIVHLKKGGVKEVTHVEP